MEPNLIDSFTVFLHSRTATEGAVKRSKTVEIPTGHVSPRSSATEAILVYI